MTTEVLFFDVFSEKDQQLNAVENIINVKILMSSKLHKSGAFEIASQPLVVTTRKIYMRTQTVFAKHLNVESLTLLNIFNFRQQ